MNRIAACSDNCPPRLAHRESRIRRSRTALLARRLTITTVALLACCVMPSAAHAAWDYELSLPDAGSASGVFTDGDYVTMSIYDTQGRQLTHITAGDRDVIIDDYYGGTHISTIPAGTTAVLDLNQSNPIRLRAPSDVVLTEDSTWSVTLTPLPPLVESTDDIAQWAYSSPEVSMRIESDSGTTATVQILDPAGKLLALPKVISFGSTHQMRWDQRFSSGAYIEGDMDLVVRFVVTNGHGLSTTVDQRAHTEPVRLTYAVVSERDRSPREVDFSLSQPARDIRVQVVSETTGQTVRTLPTKLADRGYTAKWDGMDDLGAITPTGRYRFRVIVRNPQRETAHLAGGPFTADRTPPTVSVRATTGKRTSTVGPKTRLTPKSTLHLIVRDDFKTPDNYYITVKLNGVKLRTKARALSNNRLRVTLRPKRGWWPQRAQLTWNVQDWHENVTEDSTVVTFAARTPTLTKRVAAKYAEQAFARSYGRKWAQDRRYFKRSFNCRRISRTARRCAVTMRLRNAGDYRITMTEVVRYRMVRKTLVTDVTVRGRQRWSGYDSAGKKRGKAINRKLKWRTRINGAARPTAHDLNDPVDRFPAR